MKKIFLSLAVALVSVLGVNAQVGSGPEVEFEKEVHDFGTMKQYGDASTEFKFTNTGTEPLIISNAKGSCGCTVPEWPKEEIAPGKTGEIKVVFNSRGKRGPQHKTVAITANTNPTKSVIHITGIVTAAE